MPIDQAPPGIVTSALRRMVAVASPSALAAAMADCSSAKLEAKYSPADAAIGNSSATARVIEDACGARTPARGIPRQKLEFIDYPVQIVLLLAQSDAGRILDHGGMLFSIDRKCM
ncbi:hypothetical protein AB4120_01800 [Cupriavidus sp. 2KB_3]|uniref:hypothetical protein n=1 Tax=Cupriavidus sp. 2KB_3 TaxID=3232980 RepID=UPI003F8E4588